MTPPPDTPNGRVTLARLEEQNINILQELREIKGEQRLTNQRLAADHDRVTRMEVCAENHETRMDGIDKRIGEVDHARKLESRIIAVIAGMGGLGGLIVTWWKGPNP